MEHDQVIVGGGIAGLYTCYKLKDSTNKALFESTFRLGGRLLTDKYMDFVLDYGPSRFQILNHLNFKELLDELNISYEETSGYKTVNIVPDLTNFKDDEIEVYNKCIQDNLSPVFGLLEYAIIKILGDQWDHANNHIFNEAREISMTYLKVSGTYNNRPLWTYGIWSLLCDILSTDALLYIKTNSTFYQMIDYNLNALSHICFILDILAARGYRKLYKLKSGMEELVNRIEKEIEYNTVISKEKTLISISKNETNHKLKLTFQDKFKNQFDVYTRRLFLCLNQAGLKSIKGLPKEIEKNLDSVIPIKLFKLFAIIKDPPWKNDDNNLKHINNSYVPCREIRYNYTPENNLGEILLYGDYPSINYWRYNSENQSYQVIPENNNNTDFKQQIQNVLYRIFPENDSINIVHYGIRDWSLPPFYAGIHFWKPNVNPEKICNDFQYFRIGQNFISICGEAFAFNQGYIESALVSVNNAFQKERSTSIDRIRPIKDFDKKPTLIKISKIRSLYNWFNFRCFCKNKDN
jgi:monoamine oxidase